MRRTLHRTKSRSLQVLVAVAFATVALLFTTAASAQMKDSTIKVFRMDCAPCAYGISKRLEKMDGIDHVDVDLNTGDVDFKVREQNELTLREIRDKVRKSGFTPREAELRMQVRVKQVDGQLDFELPSGERFRATNDVHADLEVGDEVVVAGTTEAELEEAPAPIGIEVKEVSEPDENPS